VLSAEDREILSRNCGVVAGEGMEGICTAVPPVCAGCSLERGKAEVKAVIREEVYMVRRYEDVFVATPVSAGRWLFM